MPLSFSAAPAVQEPCKNVEPFRKGLKEHSHDFTYRAQMIVLNVYNATIDDLRRCTFFGRQ